ncbi:MAG: hypothetical protein Q8K60_07510 [Parachlamydiaceae bacterium]|nr:hypothetical protein [Parachlamydiaceae bacterium]
MNPINQLFTKRFRSIILIIIVSTVCSRTFLCEEKKIIVNKEVTDKQYKSYMKEFQCTFGKKIESELGLKRIEGGFFNNFFRNDIEFYAYHRATMEEARALVLSILMKLTEEIQKSSKIFLYLNKQSLTPESIGIRIRFVNLNNESFYDGSIDAVSIYYSKKEKKRYLEYTSTDPFSDYSAKEKEIKTDFEDLLEDAIKLNSEISNVKAIKYNHNPTIFEDELDQILTSFKKEMKEKHNLLFESIGWMVAGNFASNISEIRTKCMYRYPVDCQKARELVLLATEKLLKDLNSNKKLIPYLKEHPFSADRIRLRLLFRKQNYFVGNNPFYESMESVVLNENMITYYHHISDTKTSGLYERVVYKKETYPEAQKIQENTNPPTTIDKFAKQVQKFSLYFNYFLDLLGLIFLFVLFFAISPVGLVFIIIGIIIFDIRRRRHPSKQKG